MIAKLRGRIEAKGVEKEDVLQSFPMMTAVKFNVSFLRQEKAGKPFLFFTNLDTRRNLFSLPVNP